jgi:tetratricopeptide (TPR) repeat protein
MRNPKEKVIVFFVGLTAIILLVEISLRILGFGYSKDAYYDTRLLLDDKQYTILCIGDSYTWGAGAPKDMSYPRQLEDLLNLALDDKRIKVINRGKPAQNTTQLIDEIQYDINAIRPNLIILMTGDANKWNFFGYQKYLKRKSLFSVLNDQIYRVRIFKLVKLLCFDIKTRSKSEIFIDNKIMKTTKIYKHSNKNNKSYYKGSVSRAKNYGISYNDTGWAYKNQGEYDKALMCFKEGLKANPADSRNYSAIGWIYIDQGEYDKALKWLKAGIKMNPVDTNGYNGIGRIYKDQGKYREAIEFFKNSEKFNPELKDFIKMFEAGENINVKIVDWVSDDIEKIIKICKENQVTIMLQDYPEHAEFSDVFKNIALKHSIFFVDNYQIFREMWNRGFNRNDYFVTDGHCNSKGYAIMARNLYDKIIVESIFNTDNHN